MTFAAVYVIIVGILMFGQWAFFLATKQVPELKTEPIRIRFHIADEFITGGLLIASGIGMLAKSDRATKLYPVAMGMLLYTVIVSAGYFRAKARVADRGDVCGVVDLDGGGTGSVLALKTCQVFIFRQARTDGRADRWSGEALAQKKT